MTPPGPDQPGHHELGIGVYRGPRPNISNGLRPSLDLPILGSAKTPNLIALNPLALQVAQDVVLVNPAHLSDLSQEAQDSSARGTGEPGCRSGGIALDECPDDSC